VAIALGIQGLVTLEWMFLGNMRASEGLFVGAQVATAYYAGRELAQSMRAKTPWKFDFGWKNARQVFWPFLATTIAAVAGAVILKGWF